jgi:CDP-glucose 4,6-dehydratase
VKIAALVRIRRDFWTGRRVLVTGHTGFKGAWLCLWLQSLGAEVTGISRDVPTEPSLYGLAGVGSAMREVSADVCDADAIREAVAAAEPEILLHLAAQPLVRRSLRDPAGTYEVNVMGTVNMLEAVRGAGAAARAVVVVTSDKCYANTGDGGARFREQDPLGGSDPYSSSKACAELVAAAYRSSLLTDGGPALATARAGNVIGGGDWGADRLLADAVRAVEQQRPLKVRNPAAVRPWQHVLGAVGGYLRLCEVLWEDPAAARAWNFGPRADDERPVAWLVERLAALWGGELEWVAEEEPGSPEASHLALDSSAAELELGWEPACDLERALALLVEWHRAQQRGEDMRAVSLAQIASV